MNPHITSVAIAGTTTSSSPHDLDLDLTTLPFQLQMIGTTTTTTTTTTTSRRRPRKKRSRIETNDDHHSTAVKVKYNKKPDPNAPKITPPCTECGKRFWSNKALFGHMRCHPERQWRGIIPPINFRRPVSVSPNIVASTDLELTSIITDEDQDIANCLLLLANGDPNSISRVSDFRFECSSCKKVFGSHQALGGHRASHKNVRGCFAIAKSDEETEDEITLFGSGRGHERRRRSSINLENQMSMMILGTQSSHKRLFHNWENQEAFVNLDLNMPAPVEEEEDHHHHQHQHQHASSSSNSSGLTLDLRLGL